MKTIINSIIGICLICAITTGFVKQTGKKQILRIQAVEKNTPPNLLSLSAKIISGRLTDFSAEKFEVKVDRENAQILVTLEGDWDKVIVEELLLQKGTLVFYENSGDQAAVISGNDIEGVHVDQDKTSGRNEIYVQFKQSAAGKWADATKRNLEHAISIVLDEKVIAAPVVRSVIEGGKCTITGGFTLPEAKKIAALANNGELPVSFVMIR